MISLYTHVEFMCIYFYLTFFNIFEDLVHKHVHVPFPRPHNSSVFPFRFPSQIHVFFFCKTLFYNYTFLKLDLAFLSNPKQMQG